MPQSPPTPLGRKTQLELVQLALQVLDECEGGEAATKLADLVAQGGGAGVAGEMKNLIFAADGPKPEFVFSDRSTTTSKRSRTPNTALG